MCTYLFNKLNIHLRNHITAASILCSSAFLSVKTSLSYSMTGYTRHFSNSIFSPKGILRSFHTLFSFIIPGFTMPILTFISLVQETSFDLIMSKYLKFSCILNRLFYCCSYIMFNLPTSLFKCFYVICVCIYHILVYQFCFFKRFLHFSVVFYPHLSW